MNPQDLFGMMGGMGGMGGMDISEMFGGGHPANRQTRGRDVGVRTPVDLATLYKGGVKEVPLPRTVLCSGCKGTGNKNGVKTTCTECNGKKRKIVRRMIGPGMVQQMQVPCEKCQGQGDMVQEKDKCKKCNGSKVKEEERVLKVQIKPGMEDGEQIVFEGAGDQGPDIDIPGSVIAVLQAEEDKNITRNGDDLEIKQTITLAESLCGFAFEFKHLDGRVLYVKTPNGKVVPPGFKMSVKGEGMPRLHGSGKGDLNVTFHVEFPKCVDDDQLSTIKSAFTGPKNPAKESEEAEECFMEGYTPEMWQSMMESKMGEDEEEDMEDGGPQGVQCSHQ